MRTIAFAAADLARFRGMVRLQLAGAEEEHRSALLLSRSGERHQRPVAVNALAEIAFCRDLLEQIGGHLSDPADLLTFPAETLF